MNGGTDKHEFIKPFQLKSRGPKIVIHLAHIGTFQPTKSKLNKSPKLNIWMRGNDQNRASAMSKVCRNALQNIFLCFKYQVYSKKSSSKVTFT